MSITTKSLLRGTTVLVAALAWNEAAKAIVDYIVPIDRDHNNKRIRMMANVAYAVIVTIFIIMLIYSFNRINSVRNFDYGISFDESPPDKTSMPEEINSSLPYLNRSGVVII